MAFKFSSVAVETMAKYLCCVLDISNREGYLCGHGKDQVYGGAYDALKALLHKEIGVRATEIAMNDNGWCYSDFAGQIIPCIEFGIKEADIEVLNVRAKRMIEYLENNLGNRWVFDHGYGDSGITVYLDDEEQKEKIPLDWNDIHDFAEKNQ